MSCDLLTIAGHKVYGPKGVGALYVREGVALSPIIAGAGQEHGLRGGTENVAGIVGLGAACRLAGRRLNEGVPERIRVLRDRLWIGLKERIPDIVRTSADAPTLPNTLHVRFPGVTGNAVLAEAPLIAASTGSACHAGSDAPPSAITALGVTESEAVGSVRLSLGVSTTEADVDHARDLLTTAYERARGRNSPVEHR
jgi:cysteine desulfurase